MLPVIKAYIIKSTLYVFVFGSQPLAYKSICKKEIKITTANGAATRLNTLNDE
jgi:hypothetical protein